MVNDFYKRKFQFSDYKYDVQTHKFIPTQALPSGASDLNIKSGETNIYAFNLSTLFVF
jgi:hypothetical protein